MDKMAATRQYWARVGMSMSLTEDEMIDLLKEGQHGFEKLLREGKVILDGETYFPNTFSQNGTLTNFSFESNPLLSESYNIDAMAKRIGELKQKLKKYEGEDILTVIVWHKDDLKSALQKGGVHLNEENIQVAFRNAERTLKDLSVEHGWEVLDDIVSDMKHNGDFIEVYSKEELYEKMKQAAEDLELGKGFEVLHEVEDSYPELRVKIDELFDLTVVADRVESDFESTEIYEEEVEIESIIHPNQEKYLSFIFSEEDIRSYERIVEIMVTIRKLTHLYR